MKHITLKLALTILVVVLFVSCKPTSETETNNRLSQRNQRGQPSIEQLFTDLDSNKDEKLSESEVKGPLKNDFYEIDSDYDGYITKEELEKAPKPNRQGQGKQQGFSRINKKNKHET